MVCNGPDGLTISKLEVLNPWSSKKLTDIFSNGTFIVYDLSMIDSQYIICWL